MTIPLRRTKLAALGAGLLIALVPAAAHAVDLTIQYDASGTSHIASTGSNISLGPATLTTTVDFPAGGFTGSMPLPGTRTTFSVAGFIPVSADVSFVEAAPVEGVISATTGGSKVVSTASYYIKLSNIKVIGFPTFTGPYCRTAEPVIIPANTPEGQVFDLFRGGTLAGEFTIGDFQNCGFNTWLINELIPGSGNTVEIAVSNGRRL